ncbi:immunity 49 family protein [Streptomyces caniscabiei]|uniref:immunity 49 family protein n=1 Tax=Streptomyces caniscabiei TaxID=2746961 RepID=UPI000765FAAF|nr:immunity 49 family protein [Streptomyces caniscabiei]
MTVTIARHGAPGPDDEAFAQGLAEDVARGVGRLERSVGMIDFTFNTALLHLQARCVIDPQAAALETWEATVSAMQLGSAMFAVTEATEGVVECRIDREVRHIPAAGPQTYADAGNWLTAFWLAVVCREQKRMTQLCEIPLDRLRSAEGQYDEYVYRWVDTLQTYWLRRPGLVEKLIATLEASHPDVVSVAPRDLVQQVLYPPINLFHRFVRQDEEGFNEALVEAVELHKAYWTADEDRVRRTEGSLALGPLALACLAHDGEIPVGVQSDYLPKYLLERGWLGEFPT